MEPAKQPKPILAPAILTAFHCLLWIGFFGILLRLVPEFLHIFEEFDAELPAMTQLAINLADFTANYWYLLLPFLAAFGAVDLFVLRALYGFPKAAVLWCLWVIAMILVPLCLMAWLVLTMVIPMTNLIQSLS